MAPTGAAWGRGQLWRCIAALLLCACVLPCSAQLYEQDAVKAAFLYRFTGYVEWPPAALQKPDFTIAVLGSSEVADELGKLLSRHTVQGLPARVAKIRNVEALGSAQVLYVGKGYAGALKHIAEALGDKSVLLVTDREGALDEGAMVNFLTADQRVRFEIALPAAQRAGLKLGPGLLSVAVRVRSAQSDVGCLLDTLALPSCLTVSGL